MSIWSWANAIAWALVAFMLIVMIKDFINVERSIKEKEGKKDV